MPDGILIALLPVAASLATLIIQAVITNVNDKNKMKNELAIKVYKDRLDAYKRIFNELTDIRKHCAACNPKNPFFIEPYIMDLKNTFREVELFIELDSVKKFWDLIQTLERIDFNIRMGEIKNIETSLVDGMRKIELYVLHIKQVIGVEKLSVK